MVRITVTRVTGVTPVSLPASVNVTLLVFNPNTSERNTYERDVCKLLQTCEGDEPLNEHSVYHADIRQGEYYVTIHPPYTEGRTVTLAGKTYTLCYVKPYGSFTFNLTTIVYAQSFRKDMIMKLENYNIVVNERGDLYLQAGAVSSLIDPDTGRVRSQWRVTKRTLITKSDFDRRNVPWPGFIPEDVTTDVSELVPSLKRYERFQYANAPVSFSWGNMSSKAGESHRPLNINMLMYLKEAMNLPHFASSIVENGMRLSEIAGRSHANRKFWRDLAKETSSLFLSQYYGTRLTAKDSAEIAAAIDSIDLSYETDTIGAEEHLETTVEGYTASVSRRVTAVVNCASDRELKEANGIREATSNLKNMIEHGLLAVDIAPTAENIWDMIPYSFVVDWLVPIGANFGLSEERAWLETYHVHKVAYSETVDYTIDRESLSDDMCVERSSHLPVHIYRRIMASKFLWMPTLDYSPSLPNHWLEATTLILANMG